MIFVPPAINWLQVLFFAALLLTMLTVVAFVIPACFVWVRNILGLRKAKKTDTVFFPSSLQPWVSVASGMIFVLIITPIFFVKSADLKRDQSVEMLQNQAQNVYGLKLSRDAAYDLNGFEDENATAGVAYGVPQNDYTYGDTEINVGGYNVHVELRKVNGKTILTNKDAKVVSELPRKN